MPLDLLVGVVVGAGAASKKVRGAVRRTVVYGLAGVLKAYDKVAGLAHGAVQSVRNSSAGHSEATASPAPAEAPHATGDAQSVNGSHQAAPVGAGAS